MEWAGLGCPSLEGFQSSGDVALGAIIVLGDLEGLFPPSNIPCVGLELKVFLPLVWQQG